MRALKFIVKDQIIEKDPSCNFDGLVPGSQQYIKASFSFSPEWDGHTKVAAFYSALGDEYPPKILKDGYSCVIPAEALKRRVIKVQVIGKKGTTVVKTNKVSVEQNGGK